MEKIYQQKFRIRSYEVDARGHIQVATILNYFQEMASEHAGRLGASVVDLLPRHLTWMLSRYHLQFVSFPRWGETIQITTWSSGMRQLFATREFEMTNAHQEIVARATSSWMLLDLQKKRPVRPEDHFPNYPAELRRAIPDTFEALPTINNIDLVLPFHVRRSDLDLNQHVNHVAYIEWAMEALPPTLLQNHWPAAIEVAFRGEAFYGDKILSRTQALKSEPQPTFVHQIVRESDSKELAVLRSQWQLMVKR
ncbi:MAG: thioesterase [candidate division KSB1 bacterium]|nr:thioesterase [candidate division KSB1 bacterium]MDZ7319724.1 thioesterase [candidate division KSB1 bacterium]